MPPFTWPIEPVSIIAAFEGRYAAPEAGALLMWAVSAVDALATTWQMSMLSMILTPQSLAGTAQTLLT